MPPRCHMLNKYVLYTKTMTTERKLLYRNSDNRRKIIKRVIKIIKKTFLTVIINIGKSQHENIKMKLTKTIYYMSFLCLSGLFI